MIPFFTNPLVAFFGGAILSLVVVVFLLQSKGGTNETEQTVEQYYAAMEESGSGGPLPGTAEEAAAIKRFTDFLQNVGNPSYIRENTANAYSQGAYLNDTIVTHHGPEEIQNYFLQTADTMTSFEVKILDTSRSGPDHYIRWEMIFSAPKLAKGEPLRSVGISQVRFDPEGKVAMHQDFWDSGVNIYGQIPVVGGLITIIRERMK